MNVDKRADIQIGQRVAVGDDELVVAEDIERVARTSCASKKRRLVP